MVEQPKVDARGTDELGHRDALDVAVGAATFAGTAATGLSAYTLASSGTIISATMLMILISGFTAGPAVSL